MSSCLPGSFNLIPFWSHSVVTLYLTGTSHPLDLQSNASFPHTLNKCSNQTMSSYHPHGVMCKPRVQINHPYMMININWWTGTGNALSDNWSIYRYTFPRVIINRPYQMTDITWRTGRQRVITQTDSYQTKLINLLFWPCTYTTSQRLKIIRVAFSTIKTFYSFN